MNSCYLSIGEVAHLIGVCTKTLRRWEAKGIFDSDFRTIGNHRRYKKSRILKILGKRSQKGEDIHCALYARVSSSRQKRPGDFERQLRCIENYAHEKGYVVCKRYSDVGSGLNDKRRNLLRLLKDAALGKFEKVIVNYNDRLARFGLQIIKEYFTSWNVELEVLHPTIVDTSPHAEIITDLTAILYSFMGKMYRMRRDP